MQGDAAALQDALVGAWDVLLDAFSGAHGERRSDLLIAFGPGIPIPQCNGPWVLEDTDAAAAALGGAIDEVAATGEQPWVQTRASQTRAHAALRELGLVEGPRLPGMVLRPGELVEPAVELEIARVAPDDVDEANAVLAEAFGAPKEFFDVFCGVLAALPHAAWYVGRRDDAIVSTAVGFTVGNATGIYNVATPPEYRGRGYGAALTARAVRDGFERGAELVYLQSSEAGHGVYRRLGFRDVEEYVLFTRA
ncbi:MAG TPA: GNAT family N-acetyltransferase [Gaiellaceae bacterium]|jgi:ribosomal protein S18 acetylase RimI-like enzyme|nr:GNAT family N-acetyltransferase [Gaiellaceae bacterium]